MSDSKRLVFFQESGQWQTVTYSETGEQVSQQTGLVLPGKGTDYFLNRNRLRPIVMVPAKHCRWFLLALTAKTEEHDRHRILRSRAQSLESGQRPFFYYRQIGEQAHLILYSLCLMSAPLTRREQVVVGRCTYLPEMVWHSLGSEDGSGYYEQSDGSGWWACMDGSCAITLKMGDLAEIQQAKETLQAFGLACTDHLRLTETAETATLPDLPGQSERMGQAGQKRLWQAIALVVVLGITASGLLHFQANRLTAQLETAQSRVADYSSTADKAIVPYGAVLTTIHEEAGSTIHLEKWVGQGSQLTLSGRCSDQEQLKKFCAAIEDEGTVTQVRLLDMTPKGQQWLFQISLQFH